MTKFTAMFYPRCKTVNLVKLISLSVVKPAEERTIDHAGVFILFIEGTKDPVCERGKMTTHQPLANKTDDETGVESWFFPCTM